MPRKSIRDIPVKVAERLMKKNGAEKTTALGALKLIEFIEEEIARITPAAAAIAANDGRKCIQPRDIETAVQSYRLMR